MYLYSALKKVPERRFSKLLLVIKNISYLYLFKINIYNTQRVFADVLCDSPFVLEVEVYVSYHSSVSVVFNPQASYPELNTYNILINIFLHQQSNIQQPN